MKKVFYSMIFTVLILTIQGCENDFGHHKITVIGTGPVVTRNLDLQSFKKIENTGIANFYITYLAIYGKNPFLIHHTILFLY